MGDFLKYTQVSRTYFKHFPTYLFSINKDGLPYYYYNIRYLILQIQKSNQEFFNSRLMELRFSIINNFKGMNVFFYLFSSALQAHCYLKEQIFNLVTLTGYFFLGSLIYIISSLSGGKV